MTGACFTCVKVLIRLKPWLPWATQHSRLRLRLRWPLAIGRIAGDRMRARLGAMVLISFGGALAASAMLVALLIGHPAAALAGFALVGLGISNIVPVLFSSASRIPGITPAHGIAGVASLGYLGFLSDPPMIGAVAQVATLPVALGLVALFAAALALLASHSAKSDVPLRTGSVD